MLLFYVQNVNGFVTEIIFFIIHGAYEIEILIVQIFFFLIHISLSFDGRFIRF